MPGQVPGDRLLSTVLRMSVKVDGEGLNTVIGCHPDHPRLCLDLLPAISFTLPTAFPSLLGIFDVSSTIIHHVTQSLTPRLLYLHPGEGSRMCLLDITETCPISDLTQAELVPHHSLKAPPSSWHSTYNHL